jgi:hypothetical protein
MDDWMDVLPSAMSFDKNELAPDEFISISSKKMQVPNLISNGFVVTVEQSYMQACDRVIGSQRR